MLLQGKNESRRFSTSIRAWAIQHPPKSRHRSVYQVLSELRNVPFTLLPWSCKTALPACHKLSIPLFTHETSIISVPNHFPSQNSVSRPLLKLPALEWRIIHIMMQHAVGELEWLQRAIRAFWRIPNGQICITHPG